MQRRKLQNTCRTQAQGGRGPEPPLFVPSPPNTVKPPLRESPSQHDHSCCFNKEAWGRVNKCVFVCSCACYTNSHFRAGAFYKGCLGVREGFGAWVTRYSNYTLLLTLETSFTPRKWSSFQSTKPANIFG